MREGNASGTYCGTTCSSGTVNFNNTICYSSCPDGYENIAQVCRLKESNITNTTVVQQSGLTKTRQVPFPFIIASFILLVIILLRVKTRQRGDSIIYIRALIMLMMK